MDEKEKGRIAYELWKAYIFKNGIPGQTLDGLRRELGNTARASNIPTNNLKLFLSSLLKDIADEITSDISPTALALQAENP